MYTNICALQPGHVGSACQRQSLLVEDVTDELYLISHLVTNGLNVIGHLVIVCFNTLQSSTVVNVVWKIDDQLSEFTKLRPLERFGKEISQHLPHGTMGHTDLIVADVVSDKVISNINVAGVFHAGELAIVVK